MCQPVKSSGPHSRLHVWVPHAAREIDPLFTMALPNSSCWWLSHASEKYESVGIILPNIWKKNVPVKTSNQTFFHRI